MFESHAVNGFYPHVCANSLMSCLDSRPCSCHSERYCMHSASQHRTINLLSHPPPAEKKSSSNHLPLILLSSMSLPIPYPSASSFRLSPDQPPNIPHPLLRHLPNDPPIRMLHPHRQLLNPIVPPLPHLLPYPTSTRRPISPFQLRRSSSLPTPIQTLWIRLELAVGSVVRVG